MKATWTPLTYIRYLNIHLPLLQEVQWAVGLPNFRCDPFVDHEVVQNIQHVISNELPSAEIRDWDSSKNKTRTVFQQRIDADIDSEKMENHTFSMSIASLIQNPVCPICARNEGNSPFYNETQIELGKMAYRAIVHSWSEKAFRYFDTMACKRRLRNRHHLDHIYPVSLGFMNSVPEEIISAPINLQALPPTDNLIKGAQPGMSIHDLERKYATWIDKNPQWTELVAVRRATNAWPRSPKAKIPRRYASEEERNQAHRERMKTVYYLWEHGYSKKDIAKIMGYWESTLMGRIQLDKKYFGSESVFHTTWPERLLCDDEVDRMRNEQKVIRAQEVQEPKARRMEIRISVPIKSNRSRIEGKSPKDNKI